MVWLLVIWWNVYQPMPVWQEFNTKDACERALDTVRNMQNDRFHGACVAKGPVDQK